MPSMLLTSTHFTSHKLAQLLDLTVIWLMPMTTTRAERSGSAPRRRSSRSGVTLKLGKLALSAAAALFVHLPEPVAASPHRLGKPALRHRVGCQERWTMVVPERGFGSADDARAVLAFGVAM